ncbi:MAG: fluoride efflux transporter CrcB [Gammaproteobacteria bacterium]
MASGGAAGSTLRYLVSGLAQRLLIPEAGAVVAFPAGTLVVNVTGSLLIGLVAGLADSRALLGPDARLLLATGVLGGYTTFSAFSLETLLLLRSGQFGTALATVGLQLLLGVAAAYAGFALALAAGRPA